MKSKTLEIYIFDGITEPALSEVEWDKKMFNNKFHELERIKKVVK